MSKIMIDAGHGGKDPGAVNGSRKEKDDVLKLAKEVGKLLKNAGHTVSYTRTTDIYESPTKKAQDANDANVNYFVSLHRNSASSTSAKGVETLMYALSGNKQKMGTNINAKLAALGFTNRGNKVRTDLTVLSKTKMEALLVEVGFISNSGDNKLFDSKFSNVAKAIADGITSVIGKKSKALVVDEAEEA